MIATRHRRVLAGLTLTMAASLAACTGRALKTGDSLDAADLAVTRAEQARVGDYDAADLKEAREKLAAARDMARKADLAKDKKLAEQARWLAEEARVDAELAAARAQQSKIQAVLLQKQRSIDEATPAATPAGGASNGGQP
jgi:hypothetical protein